MEQSRTQHVKKNIVFNILKFATQLLLQFVLRTILIYFMGAEYIGLNGLFTNIFSFLNLAELGIGSAITFSMYKPIAEGDTEKVKALENLYKKFYLVIASIVLGLGLLITPFLKYLIKGGVTVNINIYVLYILYLINTLVGYFSAHKRSLLFAHQRSDVESRVGIVNLFVMTILQIIVLILTKNYYVFFVVNILCTTAECLIIHKLAKKLFPNISGKSQPVDAETKKVITKNVVALSMHKVGGAVVFSTDNILISAFLGAVTLGAYSNYYLIISSLIAIFNLIANAITASVGNLIANQSVEYVHNKFKQINLMFAILSAFCSVCFFVLCQPFIKLWTGGNEFMLATSTTLLLSISFYISKMRQAVLMFRDAAGLFWHDRWKPIIEAAVNLIGSIILAKFLGINGIVLGTIISTLCAPLWVEPLILYKHYFKRNCWVYFKQYLINTLITIVVGCTCYFTCTLIPNGGIWLLIAKFAACATLCGVLLLAAYSPTKEFKILMSTVKDLLLIRGKNK